MLTATIGQLSAASALASADYIELEHSGISKRTSFASSASVILPELVYDVLPAQVNVNTTYTIATGTGPFVAIISKANLKTSSTTNVLLTITSGAASTESIYVPILASTNTIISDSLVIFGECDSSGNVYGDGWSIYASNANGTFEIHGDSKMEAHRTFATASSTAWTYPYPFTTTPTIICSLMNAPAVGMALTNSETATSANVNAYQYTGAALSSRIGATAIGPWR